MAQVTKGNWAVWILVACLGSTLGVSMAIGALAQACE